LFGQSIGNISSSTNAFGILGAGQVPSGGLFGAPSQTSIMAGGSLFSGASATSSTGLFGQPQ
jgi:hypothetical protein